MSTMTLNPIAKGRATVRLAIEFGQDGILSYSSTQNPDQVRSPGSAPNRILGRGPDLPRWLD